MRARAEPRDDVHKHHAQDCSSESIHMRPSLLGRRLMAEGERAGAHVGGLIWRNGACNLTGKSQRRERVVGPPDTHFPVSDSLWKGLLQYGKRTVFPNLLLVSRQAVICLIWSFGPSQQLEKSSPPPSVVLSMPVIRPLACYAE